MFEGLFTAEEAHKLSELADQNGPYAFTLREVLHALPFGKTSADIFLGREIGEKEAQKRMQYLRDLGYKVYGYFVSTNNAGDPREPYTEWPAEYRCTISW